MSTTTNPVAAPLLTDVELLQRVGGADAAAFQELHHRFKGLVRDVVRRTVQSDSETDDACQNAFLAIWKQAFRYDPKRSMPQTWIAIVTRSIARDAYRSRRRHLRNDTLTVRDVILPARTITSMERDEMVRKASHALKRLPARQRTVIELAHARGLSRRQIAGLEGLPEGTVKTMIKRGADRVRIALEVAA